MSLHPDRKGIEEVIKGKKKIKAGKGWRGRREKRRVTEKVGIYGAVLEFEKEASEGTGK